MPKEQRTYRLDQIEWFLSEAEQHFAKHTPRRPLQIGATIPLLQSVRQLLKEVRENRQVDMKLAHERQRYATLVEEWNQIADFVRDELQGDVFMCGGEDFWRWEREHGAYGGTAQTSAEAMIAVIRHAVEQAGQK